MMLEKSTDDLSQELMDQPDIDSYLKENEAYFYQKGMTDLLGKLFERRKTSKAALARKAGMSEVYLHQVFSGRRKPSRDRLLCLCVDAIISYGVLHRFSLSEINDKLFAENEKTLF